MEFLSKYPLRGGSHNDFQEECNRILEEENSAYRFINGLIVPIINEEQIAQVERALEESK
jgi:hypothetical protein